MAIKVYPFIAVSIAFVLTFSLPPLLKTPKTKLVMILFMWVVQEKNRKSDEHEKTDLHE
jgi:hypothetical protein